MRLRPAVAAGEVRAAEPQLPQAMDLAQRRPLAGRAEAAAEEEVEEVEEAAAAARPAPVVAKRGSCRSAWEKRASEAAMVAWTRRGTGKSTGALASWYRDET